jgi:alkylation response protein AidB-like acyl-CoA dehydrogenase
VPEEYGGGGFSPAELVWVLVEAGRALYPAPMFASAILAPTALLATGDEAACRDMLPAIMRGERVATVAVAEWRLLWTADSIRANASGIGAMRRVSGHKIAVVNGDVADEFLVAARTAAGVSIIRIAADAAGVSVTPRPSIDATRGLADVAFNDAEGLLVGVDGDGWPVIERTRDMALAALAAEAVGGMARLTELAADHARTRRQFGVPIGSFQAVKHRVADMVVAVEIGERSAETLAWALSAGENEFPVVAGTMFAHNADAYVAVAESALQVLGGIGFTEDFPAQLYVKRARVSRALLGLPAEHRDRMIPLIFEVAP